ncbi:hypothetical protein O3M35_000013 [Rhynocoris fuscipes]|uniref:PDEase domain-containing protein n=1 Tax=Rhynocoris fuscipes TaxID=488301 RepID=A0AAW1DNP3_9HEMI
MFRHLFKNELFFGKIAAFLLAVRHGYRKKPYHNFEHAFGMMHIIFVILHLHSNDFSMFEKTCLMIASICHDIHHPGVSNTFLRLSKNPLAELYEESTLENYHSYMTRLLLDHYGLFSYLPSSEYLRYKKEIHELILYTDLDIAITTKFPLARELINDNNYDDKKHRYLLKSLIMNSADLAGQSKSLDFSGRITALWKNELHIERDKYKRLGITPDRRNDRACAKQIPDDQVNFLKYVCENCSDLLSRLLPNVRPLYKQFKHVRKEWQEHTIPIFQDVQQYYQ